LKVVSTKQTYFRIFKLCKTISRNL